MAEAEAAAYPSPLGHLSALPASLATMWQLPTALTPGGFQEAWKRLSPNMLNSLQMVISATILSSLLGSINGYLFSKWKFRGSDVLFTLLRAGYPLILTQRMGIETNSHQCGTLRFGLDPRQSVLDPLCRAHDLKNLYVVDSSFFPSSAAQNPALTIAAQALRVADHLRSVPPYSTIRIPVMSG